MAAEFSKLAEILEKQGYITGAELTREFGQAWLDEDLIPQSVSQNQKQKKWREEMIKTNIAGILRSWRKDLEIGQRALGLITGHSRNTIDQYERGQRQLGLPMLINIGKSLGISRWRVITRYIISSERTENSEQASTKIS